MLFMFVLIIISKAVFTHLSADRYSDIRSDAFFISESLVSEGFPFNWTNETVVKIGLSTNNRLNVSKLQNFQTLSYVDSLSYLGTNKEYLFFFRKNNETLNISGCIFGNSEPITGCSVNMSLVDYDDLVYVNRLLIYNSEIIELVVYVW